MHTSTTKPPLTLSSGTVDTIGQVLFDLSESPVWNCNEGNLLDAYAPEYEDVCLCLYAVRTLAAANERLLDPRPFRRAWQRLERGEILFDVEPQKHLLTRRVSGRVATITLSNTFRREIEAHYVTGIFLLARFLIQLPGTPFKLEVRDTFNRCVFYKLLLESFPEITPTATQLQCLRIYAQA